jgi:hypothetical protein
MGFRNHRERDMVFYQVFLLSPLQCTVTELRNCKRLREFEEIEISRQCWRGDCEYNKEKTLLSGFHFRIRPQITSRHPLLQRTVFFWTGSTVLKCPWPRPGISLVITCKPRCL